MRIVFILFTVIIGAIFCHDSLFLQSSDKLTVEREKYLKNYKFSPVETEVFFTGFFQGVQLFENVLNNSTCIQNAEVILKDSLVLYDLLKDFHVDFHIISKIRDIVMATKSIIGSFSGEVENCKLASDLALISIHKIVDRINENDYLTELSSHLLMNIFSIKSLIESGFNDFHQGKFDSSGLNFGKSVKLIAFWDLN